MYIKMSETLSAKYYQENKEGLQKKKLVKDIKIFLRPKTKKSDNRVMDITKISQEMKNKSLLEKNITEREKVLYDKKVF